MTGDAVAELLRELAPQVLSALVRRYGQFDACEDATQEALIEAVRTWPGRGVPDSQKGWLITVASRRLIDEVRSEQARRRREVQLAAEPAPAGGDPGAAAGQDDSLALLFLCCHPSVSGPSQIALTLRAVGGLSTAQIAAAFLVPEATMAQRISRAKQAIAASGARFVMPGPAERPARLRSVLHVLYLVFSEGYVTSAGAELTAPRLSAEAIRLARWLRRLLPEDGEVAGLLALMLLTDARRAARTGQDGSLVPLAEQDRGNWDQAQISEAVQLLSDVLPRGRVGRYQLEAAIAAVHDEAPDLAVTDWPQILALYDLLQRTDPGPMVTLNRAVAVAMVQGPAAGLAQLAALAADDHRMAAHHRLLAARAHLLELSGDSDGALAGYREAARRTTSGPERRYLAGRAQRVASGIRPGRAADRPAAENFPR
ncbi:MAG TPA: DUF6596 domain-containing protein [Streptosporangiaceae bacterium]